MGLSNLLPWSSPPKDLDDVEGSHRCIRCGAAFERDHRECPACGGHFVAPIPDANA